MCLLKMRNVTSQQCGLGRKCAPITYLRLICKLPVLSEANFVSNVNLLLAIAYANTFPLDLGTSLVEAYI